MKVEKFRFDKCRTEEWLWLTIYYLRPTIAPH